MELGSCNNGTVTLLGINSVYKIIAVMSAPQAVARERPENFRLRSRFESRSGLKFLALKLLQSAVQIHEFQALITSYILSEMKLSRFEHSHQRMNGEVVH